MAQTQLRRSERLSTYDSNGRDYLSSTLDWSRSRFEEWLNSHATRPHLQDFYQLCIADNFRFNDSVESINTGPSGYFYNASDLEEDLLLMCFCAGDDGQYQDCGEPSSVSFARDEKSTAGWLTQELWARAAWRIAQANRAPGQIFHSVIQERPAAAYGFVIEMLCIVFHSVAFRGADSVFLAVLKGGKGKSGINDEQAAAELASMTTSCATTNSSSVEVDRVSDSTFSKPQKGRKKIEKVLPQSEKSTIIFDARIEDGPLVAGDIDSEIQVSPRKQRAYGSSSSSKLDPRTANRSSVQGSNAQQPDTPDTGFSFRQATVDRDEAVKQKRIRAWLEDVKRGQQVFES